jgi:subtilisin family serine protease
MTWGIRAIGGDRQTTTGAGVKVAVLDSGLLVSHPNFSGREIMGKSFVPDQDWELDKLGHGTHCAGTICGSKSSENGLRFGVAPDVDLMVGKVLNDDGDGKGSWIIDGIDWAIEKGARVISLSLGGPTQIGQSPSPIYERIGRRALRNNCLMIAAAGNHSKRPRKMPRPVSAPANCESIMAIAAVDRDLKVASFSNAGLNAQDGGRIDLAAPGVDVYSSHTFSGPGEDHYEVMDGTSMATPHVAGVAALYLEKFPNLSATELWLKLEKNARELSNQKFRDVGNGLVTII